MLDDLRSHHGSHITAAGRISYHTGAAADEGNGLIARHLETFHKAKGHKMAYMKAVCSRIKTDVEYGFAFVYHFFDFFFVCHLGDEASGNQFFVDLHCCTLLCYSYFTIFLLSCKGLISYSFQRFCQVLRKKTPSSLSKGRSIKPVLPPDVHRQLALPASSSTASGSKANAHIL